MNIDKLFDIYKSFFEGLLLLEDREMDLLEAMIQEYLDKRVEEESKKDIEE